MIKKESLHPLAFVLGCVLVFSTVKAIPLRPKIEAPPKNPRALDHSTKSLGIGTSPHEGHIQPTVPSRVVDWHLLNDSLTKGIDRSHQADPDVSKPQDLSTQVSVVKASLPSDSLLLTDLEGVNYYQFDRVRRTYPEAQKYCADRGLRLPTEKELGSLALEIKKSRSLRKKWLSHRGRIESWAVPKDSQLTNLIKPYKLTVEHYGLAELSEHVDSDSQYPSRFIVRCVPQ